MSLGNDQNGGRRSVMDVIEDPQFDWGVSCHGRRSILYESRQPELNSEFVPQSIFSHPFQRQGSISEVSSPAENEASRSQIEAQSDEYMTASDDSIFYSASENMDSPSQHTWLTKEDDEDIMDHSTVDDDDDDDDDDEEDTVSHSTHTDDRDIVKNSTVDCDDDDDDEEDTLSHSTHNNDTDIMKNSTVATIDYFTDDYVSEYSDQASIGRSFVESMNPVFPQSTDNLYNSTKKQLQSEVFQLSNVDSWKKIEDNDANGYKVTILIGFSDVYKKMHYHKFLSEFHNMSGQPNLLILYSVDDLDSCLKDAYPNKVVVLVNAFGDLEFHDQQFSKLCKIIKRLKDEENLLALMLTSTSSCFHPCQDRMMSNMPKNTPADELIINIDHPENISTSHDDKLRALNSALDMINKDPDRPKVNLSEREKEVICKAENPVFFDCCELIKNNIRCCSNILGVFREPMEILVIYFRSLKEQSKKVFSVLALCALQDGLSKTFFDESNIDCDFTKSELLEICSVFSDSVLELSKDENSGVTTMVNFHLQMYRNAVLCVLFKDCQKDVIEKCPISFLTNVLPLILAGLCKRLVFKSFEELAKRFIREIKEGNCAFLVSNIIWKEKKFMDQFVKLIQNDEWFTIITAEDNGIGILAWSSWSGSVELVECILKQMKLQGKNKIKLKYIEDAVMLSCISGTLNTLNILYDRVWGKKKILYEICERSPTHFMCMINDFLQENYPFVSYVELQRYSTPWHTAIAYGHLEIIKFMLSKESESIVNSLDSFKCSSLHIACRLQKEEVVRFLLDKRADINLVNNIGDTPLHEACASGNVEILKMILTHRPKIENYEDVLFKAVASKNVKLLSFLFEETEVDRNGNSKFLMYSENSLYSLGAYYQELLQSENGVQSETVLHKACLLDDNLEVIKYLLSCFPTLVHKKSSIGATALHIACKNLIEHSTTQYLLEKEASINAQTDELNTPLHLACENNRFHQVTFLTNTKKAKYLKNEDDKFPHELTDNHEIVEFILNSQRKEMYICEY